MKVQSKSSFFIIVLFAVSFFTSFAILEGNAVENISVSAKGFENTIIFEFKNGEQNTAKIKTINIWLASGDSFKSFKTESAWSGKTYGNGQGLTFSTSEVLNPGESVKFGAVTNKKISVINWKAVDENENQIGPAKTEIVEISQTTVVTESETVEDESIEQTGDDLYGTKTFIPENLRVGSNMRVVGSGFSSDQTHQFYLNDEFLKSTDSDGQGNFITTIKIPDSVDAGISEFKITNMPQNVNLDETLSIAGQGHPTGAVMISIKNQGVLETIQVVDIGVDGEWNFERSISSDDSLGERTVIIRNGFKNTQNSIDFVTNEVFSISVFTATTDSGDAFILTGTAQPNKDLALSIKNPNDTIVRFDILTIDESGEIKYEFPYTQSFTEGTYVLTATQDDVTQVSLFTLGTESYDRVIVYLEKMNFFANSKAGVTVLGPPSTEFTLDILDYGDNKKFSTLVKTNSVGSTSFVVDLTGYSSGVYKAVASNPLYQDTAKFSVGLSSGSGNITFSSTKLQYSGGDNILIIGNAGANSILNISLIDPNGETVTKFEIFTDKEGTFSTDMLGIPSNAMDGEWQIKAQSGLDHKEVTITVS